MCIIIFFEYQENYHLSLNVRKPDCYIQTTKGSDQPTHPHILKRTFVVHYLEIIVGKPVPCNISIFLLGFVA